MKQKIKFLLISLSLISSTSLYASKSDPWIDIGLRANLGATNLLNFNLIDDKNLQYNFSHGFSYGAKLGFNFNEIIALNAEGILTQFGQNYKGKGTANSDWENKITLKYLEFPVLLKFTRNKWAYYEAGIKFGMLNSATSSENITDFINYFNKSNISAIFGFGHALWGNGGMLISMGTRFVYGITDLISMEGNAANYPFPKTFGPSDPSKTYKATNAVSIGLQLSLDFDLGQIATSSCGRSTKFVLFKH